MSWTFASGLLSLNIIQRAWYLVIVGSLSQLPTDSLGCWSLVNHSIEKGYLPVIENQAQPPCALVSWSVQLVGQFISLHLDKQRNLGQCELLIWSFLYRLWSLWQEGHSGLKWYDYCIVIIWFCYQNIISKGWYKIGLAILWTYFPAGSVGTMSEMMLKPHWILSWKSWNYQSCAEKVLNSLI